jgi:hypothetical protein
MTVPDELAKLGVLLEALATNAEMFCVVADDLTPGELRGAFLVYADALRAAGGYVGSIQTLAEVTDHAT